MRYDKTCGNIVHAHHHNVKVDFNGLPRAFDEVHILDPKDSVVLIECSKASVRIMMNQLCIISVRLVIQSLATFEIVSKGMSRHDDHPLCPVFCQKTSLLTAENNLHQAVCYAHD